jgi:formiminoglutamase
MNHFVPFTAENLEPYLPQRYDVTLSSDLEKEDLSPYFADKIEICTDFNRWDDISADYVVLGIPEDIGVRANMGRGGTACAWKDFLHTFLRVPHTFNNDATRFCLLGEVLTADLMKASQHLDANIHADRIQLSDMVMVLDQRVSEVIHAIKETGKTPIIIGGGHNNCYPILRAFGYSRPIDCINVDAHTDLRVTKGRHSGNGFSHAIAQGFLGNYFMIGIQENYLNNAMMEIIEAHDSVNYTALTHGVERLQIQVEQALHQVDGSRYGLEIDLDVVAHFPSSAQSPVGLSLDELAFILKSLLEQSSEIPKYFHFCEAAPDYGYKHQVGKALTHLVSLLP